MNNVTALVRWVQSGIPGPGRFRPGPPRNSETLTFKWGFCFMWLLYQQCLVLGSFKRGCLILLGPSNFHKKYTSISKNN